MTFEIITVLVVLVIFSVFYLAAHKAEKVVAAQAKAKLEMQRNMLITEASLPKSIMKKGGKNKYKVTI